MLEFEAIHNCGPSLYANIYRARIPGGWLIIIETRTGVSTTYYPDPQHVWDGASLPKLAPIQPSGGPQGAVDNVTATQSGSASSKCTSKQPLPPRAEDSAVYLHVERLEDLDQYRLTVAHDGRRAYFLSNREVEQDSVLSHLTRKFQPAAEQDFFKYWQEHMPVVSRKSAKKQYLSLRREAKRLEAVVGRRFRWVKPLPFDEK